MKPTPLPAADHLRSLIDYDPATGAMVWRARGPVAFVGNKYPAERLAKTWNTKWAGTPALASMTGNGYRHGAIDGGSFLAHRVAWKIVTGDDPDDLDHLDGDRSNNRFANLRSCARADNMRNRGLSRNNKSGAHGVWCEAKTGKWCAQIEHDGTVTDLGRYATFEEAKSARKKAELALGFHPNHGERPGHDIAAASFL